MMERRIKVLGHKHAITQHWLDCLDDKHNMNAHMRGMKRRAKGEKLFNADIISLIDEVHRVGTSKRRRKEYEDWDAFFEESDFCSTG